ncbi:MAG: hypothetical protein KBB83_06775 [Alphaproteobacteria bacterium]|nr:hypothetical protein [Alphaproteobacteria bacterium]
MILEAQIDIDAEVQLIRSVKKLYIAVIEQAFFDMSKGGLDGHNAKNWLLKNGRDFRYVCDMAGFDPVFIRECAEKVITKGIVFKRKGGGYGRYDKQKKSRIINKDEYTYSREAGFRMASSIYGTAC